MQRPLAASAVFSDRVVRSVAVYDAQGFEVPLGDLVTELSSRGVTCVFPRIVKGQRALQFCEAGEQWARGPLGLREPPSYAAVRPLETIDVFLVPGVAFTLGGQRLGRGGGYYDATLALRAPGALCVGVSFACQLVERLPTDPHDVEMDFLATERGLVRASR